MIYEDRIESYAGEAREIICALHGYAEDLCTQIAPVGDAYRDGYPRREAVDRLVALAGRGAHSEVAEEDFLETLDFIFRRIDGLIGDASGIIALAEDVDSRGGVFVRATREDETAGAQLDRLDREIGGLFSAIDVLCDEIDVLYDVADARDGIEIS
jgi:hypothetical protein